MATIKLFRFGDVGSEKPGIVTADGIHFDVSAFGEDYTENFFATNGIARLEKWFNANRSQCAKVPDRSRIASCVARPSKIVAIGLNYREHVREGGGTAPAEPVIFMKASTAMTGPYDNVIIPRNSVKMDYEVELAIVVGKRASYVPADSAMRYIAGFTIINDYSEREWQLERPGGQWDKGKSADTFAPLGPYLVTPAQSGDPNHLSLWLSVNGKKMQQANTADMIFNVERLLSEVSKFMTLLPGDVIATGTPSGVGLGQKPPLYLKPGDVVELGIENLGSQKQTLVSPIQYYLGDDAYKDYQAWVALGVGGLPHTFDGYQTVKRLGKNMKNPFDVANLERHIGKAGDVSTLKRLPKRKGPRPTIAPFAIPHRQTDQHNDTVTRNEERKWIESAAIHQPERLTYKRSFFEKHNDALFVKDSLTGNHTLMPITHAEIAHVHPSDGSMHMILSPSDAKVVIESGWGELHGLAGQVFAPGRELAPGYIMIYSPRTKKELEIAKQILEAAIRYNCNP
ncbi:fumarylacetoacetate hydrolase family protein [Chryseolinea soli]|uniref:fumarylacetoacetate hydrolase family protein n=1 Tax=Chryseolinea soli TaxID=2321403 RepID=UPI003002539B